MSLCLVLFCAGCESMPTLDDVGSLVGIVKPPPDPALQMPALEQRIAVLVAYERQKIDPNAKALAIDPELTGIARERAADMASKNYFAHSAPNGDTSATLLMAADAKFQGLLGENLAAQHYSKDAGIDVDAFAHRFVDTWLASPPHKENLSFADYNLTGVGAAVNGDTVYVTQLFSTDLGLGPHDDHGPPAQVTPIPSPNAAKTKPETQGMRGAILPRSQ